MIGVDGKKGENEISSLPQFVVQSIKHQQKFFFMTSAGFIILYSFLSGFWKIPGLDFGINRITEIGISDIIYLMIISVLAALFILLWKQEQADRVSSTVGGIGSVFAGAVGAICPACQTIGVVALGSTLLSIPATAVVPYLGLLKLFSIGILGLAVYMKAESTFTKTCKACVINKSNKSDTRESFFIKSDYVLGGLAILIVLLFVNQLLIPQAYSSISLGGGTSSLGSFQYGSKITLKPMPLAVGEQPKIPGYGSTVKSIPTISELPQQPNSGDALQDLLNNIVPKGTPWYGAQAQVSFDDPISAQKQWGSYRSISLNTPEQERWNRIVNSFTCDYCCGSPQRPTIITHCGCAHAMAAQGMAKWLVKNYGSQYSDEEVYGEMARWYALWYPKGTIERIIQEAQ